MTPVPGPNEGLNAAVAAELRAERAAQRVTLQELADASAVPLMSVRRYLNADRHIDIATLQALAAALGTTALAVVESAEARRAREAMDAESAVLPGLRAVDEPQHALSDDSPSLTPAIAAHEDGSIAAEQESTNET